MSNNYLNINPIARRLSLETLRIFENESVDELVEKLSSTLFDTYKKVVVDFAPSKQRKISSVKEKLKDTANTSSLKSLVAKIKDYSKETETYSHSLSDAKDLYLDAIDQIADSLKRMVEIDPKIEDKIIKGFQKRTSKYVQAYEEALKMEKEEQESLNESFSLGLRGRVEALKHKLRKVLIPESYGKNADNGYGRNWYRIFTELDQTLTALDHRREISSDKEKKALKDLESKTDKYSKEFHTYCTRATEAPFKKILSDEELSKKFEEVKDMVSSAFDVLTRATTEESNVEERQREKSEEHDHKVNSLVFPIQVNDDDSHKKFKDSLIIANLQKALINSFPPFKDILSKWGGASGKFTPGMEVVIKSIQSTLGNKDKNGQIDRALFDTILNLDKISPKDKAAVEKSLEILREEYISEGIVLFDKPSSVVLSSSEFFGRMNEASVHLDMDKLSSEIEKFSQEISEPETSKGKKSALGYGDRSDNTDQAYELAKLLRSKGFVKGAEEETFLREDGTLRASYTPEFMIAWTKTCEDANEKDLPSFFWVNFKGSKIDGLYATKRLLSSAKKPCNWPKWKEIIGDTDEEDLIDFSNWYSSYYSNFGGIDNDSLASMAKNVFNTNSEEKEENSKTYDRLRSYFSSKKYESRYVPYSVLDDLKSSFIRGAQIEEKIQDLSESDFGLLANLIAFVSSTFTFDKKKEKFVPTLEIIMKDVLTEDELKKLSSEESLGSSETSGDIVAVLDKKQGIRKANRQDKESGESRNKKVFEQNLKRAKEVILPIIEKHVARMNAKNPDDLSRSQSKGIYIVPEE